MYAQTLIYVPDNILRQLFLCKSELVRIVLFQHNLIDRVIHVALTAALIVWKTTPNLVLYRESIIPLVRISLEGNRLCLATRSNSLDNYLLLCGRASMCLNVGTLKYKKTRKLYKRPDFQISRIQRVYWQLSLAVSPVLLTATVYTDKLGSKPRVLEVI